MQLLGWDFLRDRIPVSLRQNSHTGIHSVCFIMGFADGHSLTFVGCHCLKLTT